MERLLKYCESDRQRKIVHEKYLEAKKLLHRGFNAEQTRALYMTKKGAGMPKGGRK